MGCLRFKGSSAALDVLGAHGRSPDHEDVDARGDHVAEEVVGLLRRQRSGHRDAGLAHLLHAGDDQLRLDGLGVEALQHRHRIPRFCRADLLERVGGVLVPGPQTLEVQHPQATGLTHGDGRGRRNDRVHRRGHDRQPETVGVDLPRQVHGLRIPRTPVRRDGHVVEGIPRPGRLGQPDHDVAHGTTAYWCRPRSCAHQPKAGVKVRIVSQNRPADCSPTGLSLTPSPAGSRREQTRSVLAPNTAVRQSARVSLTAVLLLTAVGHGRQPVSRSQRPAAGGSWARKREQSRCALVRTVSR